MAIDLLRGLIWGDERRSHPPLDFDDWVKYFGFGAYPFGLNTTLGQPVEEIEASFQGILNGAYKRNGPIFSVMLARQMLFSEARFQWRERQKGRPGDLFGSPELSILEAPWPGGTTGDLLAKMLQHADLAGDAFVVRRPTRLQLPRPDWMTIVLGSRTRNPDFDPADLDAELVGYMYHPGGKHGKRDPVALLPEEVAHFAPVPDPDARYRGMPWIVPILQEVMGDQAITTHKIKFFEQGATPNLVVSLDPEVKAEMFDKWVDKMEERHAGALNAWKTLYVGAGSKVQVVGTNMEQVAMKAVTGVGETRIAAAGGVPPIIAGFSEGLESATYSNYGQARRRFADLTMRPLWRNAAGSLQTILRVPRNAELWYDDRDIAFLAEDVKDRVEAQQKEANTIRALIDAGFKPETVIAAVTAGDWERLKHSGLFSVQLQPPMPEGPTTEASPEDTPDEDVPAMEQ